MIPAPDKYEDEWVRLLAGFDEALAGVHPDDTKLDPPDDWDAAHAERLERAQRCLRDLERLWPRRRHSEQAEASAPTDVLLAQPYRPLEVGTRLGDYRITGVVGAGGMGIVYRAEHDRMKRTVALKVLSPRAVSTPLVQMRFQRDVEMLAQLQHPHVVTAYDARAEGDLCFFVMELIVGRDLGDVVREAGPLAPAQAIDYVLQAARGLEYAHSRGIVHRDIKPSNLMLDSHGVIKILDLGLAQLQAEPSALV